MVKAVRPGVAIVALALTLAAGPAEAQNALGGIAGFNLSNLTFDPPISKVYAEAFGFDARSSGVNGLAAGISFERAFGGRFDLRMEGLFSQAGAVIEGTTTSNGMDYTFEETIQLSMLEVPVMVGFLPVIDGKVRLMGGGFLAVNLSQKQTVHETLGTESRDRELHGDDRAQIKSTHAGIALGAEVDLTRRVGVGGRFNLGLTNLDDEDDFDSVTMRILRIYVVIKLT